ncbi:hypothetical protein [Novibacillus thermophilus]|uniref:hypothetical protein n=1 Tax=Novibacillus thermophilus TaxID=1471761 RepID=UPI001475AE91|nr:hypothetical protein [Novibacillus thermophilus]
MKVLRTEKLNARKFVEYDAGERVFFKLFKTPSMSPASRMTRSVTTRMRLTRPGWKRRVKYNRCAQQNRASQIVPSFHEEYHPS